MENLIIRRATINDLKTVQNLNQQLFNYEMEKGLDDYIPNWAVGDFGAEYFTNLIENEFCAIAEVDKTPIGYLSGSIYRDNSLSYYRGLTCELNDMFVKSEFRKFGIGSKLIENFVNWCKENNGKRIFVTATVGNDNAIEFYKKQEFKELNIILKKELSF